MGRPATTVAFTTGTSLKTNLSGADGDFDGWTARQPVAERESLLRSKEAVQEAARAAGAGRWEAAGLALAQVEGTPRVLGAELSSKIEYQQEHALAYFDRIHTSGP